MATPPQVVEFDRHDITKVVGHLDRIAALDTGLAWVNIGPALTDEQYKAVPHRSGMGKWVSGRGPAVPMATWTPAAAKGRTRLAQAGITHGLGPNALDTLADAGVSLPVDWVKKQDHARNGIVVDLPDGVAHEELVTWFLAAMDQLSTFISTGDQWIAEIHTP
jgi:hypothetical protein